MNKLVPVVVPAAGSGQRMRQTLPKQYAPLCGRTVIDWTLDALLQHPRTGPIVVALATTDIWFGHLPVSDHSDISTVAGGATRAESVLRGLEALQQIGWGAQDWVAVHDAARPCLRQSDLDALLAGCAGDGVVLGWPVADSLKRVGRDGRPRALDRAGVWVAATPQVFRLGKLVSALQSANSAHAVVTDEASAMEWLDNQADIRLIEGCADNIKITRPQDLPLAEAVLGLERGR